MKQSFNNNAILKLVTIGLATSLASCSVETMNSDELKTQRIYHDYTVTYDESAKTLTAKAEFKFNTSRGDYINLISPAKILFGENPNAESPSPSDKMVPKQYSAKVGRFYTSSKHDPNLFLNKTKLQRTFSYTDSDQNVLTTPVTVKKLLIKSLSDSIEIGKSFKVSFSILEKVSSKDVVTLEIVQPRVDDTHPEHSMSTSIAGKMNGTLTIGAEEISNLEKRPATISVYLISDQSKELKTGRTFAVKGKYYTPAIVKTPI